MSRNDPVPLFSGSPSPNFHFFGKKYTEFSSFRHTQFLSGPRHFWHWNKVLDSKTQINFCDTWTQTRKKERKKLLKLRLAGERRGSAIWRTPPQKSEWDKFLSFCSDKAPTNKIYRRASSEQRPRTRSCHESERLVWALFRSNVPFGKSFFRSRSRAAGDFSQRRLKNSLLN